MRKLIALVAIGLATAGLASSANAYSFSPVSSSFSGKGPATASLYGINLGCNARLAGSTDAAGVGTITFGVFTGSIACNVAVLAGLPWSMTATSLTSVTVPNVSLTSPLGTCGPGDLTFTLVNGVFTYAGTLGFCNNVTLKLKTTPPVSIVP